ncbi:uncharacterized protein TNCV_1768571 [Trichonephila clavipes]|nr:uncharacterized protein TNCV_1768571 [Trichonephila clavipes]
MKALEGQDAQMREYRQNRLKRCRSQPSCLLSDWHRKVFSDKSRFPLEADDHRLCVWISQDASDRGQIMSARGMGHSISEIVRQLGFSRSAVSRKYQKYMDGGQKTSDKVNCKGQLVLTELGERQLRRIVRSQ